MRNTLKGNDKGAALVAVIMAMLVLSIMSLAVLSATTSNVKNGLEEREYQSSYYIAEGGVTYHAQEVKSEILDIYNDPDIDTADDFFNAIDTNLADPGMSKTLNVSSGHFEEQYGGAPDAEVRVIKDTGPSADPNMRTYIIESTGTVDGIPRKVYKPITFKWIDKDSAVWQSKYAVYTKGNMNNIKGKIKGPVFSDADITFTDGMTLDGDAFAKKNIYAEGGIINGFTHSLENTNLTRNGHITGNVYSNKRFDMNSVEGGKVEGSVYAKGEVTKNSGDIGNIFSEKTILVSGWGETGEVYQNTTVTLPDFPTTESPINITEADFPIFPSPSDCVQKASMPIDSNTPATERILNLTNSVTYVPNISVESDVDMTIKYSDNCILMVENFDVGQGTIKLDGTGLLKIYVKGNITTTGSSKFNYNDSTDYSELKKTAEKLMIYIGPSAGINKKSFSLAGDTRFNGSVFAYDANISLDGSGNMVGNIFTLGSKVEISGGAEAGGSDGKLMLYAPNADTEFSGSGTFNGPIISNTFKTTGNGTVIYEPNIGLPVTPLTPIEPLDNVDGLIASETPITEK